MRILPPIIIIIFGHGLESCVAAGNRNHKRKSKDNALQTVQYLEHRNVSLRVYGATKDLEGSKLPSEHRVDDYLSVTLDKKSSNTTRKHHNNRHAFHNTSISRRGTAKEARKAESDPVQNDSLHQATARIARTHPLHSAEKSKHESLSAKNREDKATSPTKKHKIPGTFRHQRHKTTSKRTKVDEDLSSEGQNIAKTIDSLDDLQESYSKGVGIDSVDITEVKKNDNNTLSDYFHALNDNESGGSKNDNTENDYSEFVPTRSSLTPKLSWDEMTSPTERSSGDDDFYDAIDNGDEPPPLKMKKIRPSKSHFNKQKDEPTETDSKAKGSGSFSQSTDFRSPSHEDFENFFRGMLDHFGNARPSQGHEDQNKNYDSKDQEKEKGQRNVTSFPVRHYENHNGNLTKLVSLGSPERADVAHHMQQPSLVANEDAIPTFFKGERDQEGGRMTSFVSLASPSYWVRRPFDANGNAASEQLVREEKQDSPVNAPSTQHIQLPKKQTYEPTRLQDATLLPVDIQKETRIMGGNISGGQISGGVIEGGQIKAGLIEGGLIKGGQIVGGHITNGTMEGGVVANGQMSGGHLVNGRIEGGKLLGGNVFGGRIVGGSVEGGEIKGGVVAGGRFSGGSMQGGLLKGGEIHSGTIKGGKVEGGILQGGNIEGGEFRFGEISGGTLKSGSMLGGLLKNGSIEGGTLKGGTIEGGVLKGGIMEGGKLKGGLVLAGKIKGGVIEGGVIEGGEIGDGVVITGGKVNATIVGTGSSIDKNQRLGGLFKQGEKPHQLGLSVDQQKEPQGSEKPVHGSEHLPDPMRGPQPVTHVNQGLQEMQANADLKIPLREGILRMLPQENDTTDDDSLEKLLIEGKSANDDNFDPELSSHRFFDEQEQSNRVIQRKGGKHHVFFDGVGYDIPNEDFVDLIDKMKNRDLVNNYKQPEKDDLRLKIKSNSMNLTAMTNLHIKPEDLEKTLSFPTKARSSVSRSDKKKSGHDSKQEKSKPKLPQAMKTVKLNNKENERRKFYVVH